MATVIRENLGLLNDKLVVKVKKDDYLPSFEKAIKDYGRRQMTWFRKNINILWIKSDKEAEKLVVKFLRG